MRDHFHLVGIYNSMNINTQMSSSEEPIRCDECGQEFDTIDSLKEHQEVERQEKELRSKGIDD
jgi:transcription initiation factor IIE alpha subunit